MPFFFFFKILPTYLQPRTSPVRVQSVSYSRLTENLPKRTMDKIRFMQLVAAPKAPTLLAVNTALLSRFLIFADPIRKPFLRDADVVPYQDENVNMQTISAILGCSIRKSSCENWR